MIVRCSKPEKNAYIWLWTAKNSTIVLFSICFCNVYTLWFQCLPNLKMQTEVMWVQMLWNCILLILRSQIIRAPLWKTHICKEFCHYGSSTNQKQADNKCSKSKQKTASEIVNSIKWWKKCWYLFCVKTWIITYSTFAS